MVTSVDVEEFAKKLGQIGPINGGVLIVKDFELFQFWKFWNEMYEIQLLF